MAIQIILNVAPQQNIHLTKFNKSGKFQKYPFVLPLSSLKGIHTHGVARKENSDSIYSCYVLRISTIDKNYSDMVRLA